MQEALRDYEILDLIGTLTSQRASGRLQINTGMTEGALFFDRGQLVEAWLGKLTGFQAINALASVGGANYDFDPTIAPPAQSSITARERLLLKDFFGIDAIDREQSHDAGLAFDEVDAMPSSAVPLAGVEDPDSASVLEPQSTTTHEEQYPETPHFMSEGADDEVTLVKPKRVVPWRRLSPQAFTKSTFRPALFVILLTVLVAAAAIALMYRSRKSDSVVSVAPAVQNASPTPAVQTASPAEVSQAPTTESQQPKTENTAALPDLTGNWKVTNTVDQTSYAAYKNMEIGFTVSINQAGKDFTGKGEKISENGRSLPRNGRTPISVKGTIDGDKVEATFSENGAMRTTNGRFVWRINKSTGGLTGTFVSTAAGARGRSAATKEL